MVAGELRMDPMDGNPTTTGGGRLGLAVIGEVDGNNGKRSQQGCGVCFMSAGWGGGIGIGGGVGMGVCVGSAFAKEEDGRCWLVNRVSIFRRRRSSLAAMEAWVTTRSAMAASRRSKHSEESSSSAIGVLNESTKLL